MANGDVDVKVRFRSFLPGAGYDVNGQPKQGKTDVRGVITTTYLRGGVSLTAQDVGLTVIDTLSLVLVEPNGSEDPGRQRRGVAYSPSAAQFYLSLTITGDEAGEDKTHELASGQVVDVSFDAFGDSGATVDLI